MTKETIKKLKKGDTVYVACKVDAVFIESGLIQVSTRDCDNGFDAYEDEVLEPCEFNGNESVIDQISAEIQKLRGCTCSWSDGIIDDVEDIIDECKAEVTNLTTKSDLAQERYQDLIDYFDDKETAKIILEDREEFKAWLERLEWHVKKADELARELEQLQKKNI